MTKDEWSGICDMIEAVWGNEIPQKQREAWWNVGKPDRWDVGFAKIALRNLAQVLKRAPMYADLCEAYSLVCEQRSSWAEEDRYRDDL